MVLKYRRLNRLARQDRIEEVETSTCNASGVDRTCVESIPVEITTTTHTEDGMVDVVKDALVETETFLF